jgi:hypothetical protein
VDEKGKIAAKGIKQRKYERKGGGKVLVLTRTVVTLPGGGLDASPIAYLHTTEAVGAFGAMNKIIIRIILAA